ncbi:MAG: hypothetical protein HC899_34000 [Leptolyngbyaceae cyanobacterium SM1_4_3]|nr:hypothetical protein [Leptolyngbyaceae cyanobacterium SM1_4_3]
MPMLLRQFNLRRRLLQIRSQNLRDRVNPGDRIRFGQCGNGRLVHIAVQLQRHQFKHFALQIQPLDGSHARPPTKVLLPPAPLALGSLE